jgi:hypothetical protein
LSVVFSFSEGLRGVLSIARTCRNWYAAAGQRLSSCRAKLVLDRAVFLQMLHSPLRCHVAGLELRGAKSEDLLLLHERCSQLEELTIRLDGDSIAALANSHDDVAAFNAHAWPSSLRSLSLPVGDQDAIVLQPLLNALPCSAVRLQSLSLVTRGGDSRLDWAPLLQLPQLTSLSMNHSPSSPQLAVVKQLCLTALDVSEGHCPRESLRVLLSDEPHQLQRLQKISMHECSLDVESMQMLLTLPLTELQPWQLDPRCFPLLRSFAMLRQLRVAPQFGILSDADAAELLSSLSALPNLISLEIVGRSLSAVIKEMLLDGLAAVAPQLHELRLFGFSPLPSLARLAACTQLRSLHVVECSRQSRSSIRNVLDLLPLLRHLERFFVTDCRLRLSDEQRAQLTPPSVLVPSLKHFEWSGRFD